MKLSEALTETQIIPTLQAETCWEAITELVDHLIDSGTLSIFAKEAVLDGLREREHQNGTGVGEGVAIPHAFIDEVQQPTVALGRSARGVEFECPDQLPTEFIVLLILPKVAAGGCHLQILSEVARVFHLCEIRKQLHEAENAQAILNIFIDLDETVTTK